MNLRDLKAFVLGAALCAIAFLSVRGRDVTSRARERGKVDAGETERAEPTTSAVSEDPAMAANANLAAQVHHYKERLETIGAQKAATEKQLADAQRKLAAIDGSAPVRSEYDLSPEDWKKLAAEGTVKIQTPCIDMKTTDVSASALASVGLPPGDAKPIHDALWDVELRTWSVIRALCAKGLHGNVQLAGELGPEACAGLIEHMGHKDGGDLEEQTRIAAEIRAGLVPMPPDPSSLGPYTQLLLAELSESQQIEEQLAKAVGPDDAHAFVYGGAGCWEHFTKSAGPRQQGPR